MSIVAAEIIYYGAASIAEVDAVTQGGAIDATVRYIFDSSALINDPTASGGAGTVMGVSDNGADTTQTVTVTGRDATGSIVTDTIALNGTTVVAGASGTIFERIMKIVLSGAAAGIVTISDDLNTPAIGTTIVDIEALVTSVRVPFYDVSSDASGGASRDFYEKVFIKNTNATLSYLTMQVAENADPSAVITFDLEDAVDDNNSTADRLDTAPTGMLGSFDGTTKAVPGTDLAAASAIGVWLKLTLSAGLAAAKTTYTLQTTGSTT